MNLLQARDELFDLTEAGNAVLLRSSSGIGKSQMVYETFKGIRDRDAKLGIRWGFGTIFAATQTPPDLIGYQFKGERSYTLDDGQEHKVTITDPSVPLWMMSTEGKPAFMYDKFFLLIDEYGQGEADVKRAIAEIFLNGGTSPWYLPAGSIRVACTNQGARYGVSKDFDFCIARRTEIDIEGDTDIWLDYADKPYQYQGKTWQTTPEIKSWVKSNPTLLFEREPEKQGPFCNPRQICAVDRYLQTKWARTGQRTVNPIVISAMAGTIGMPATQSLYGHLQAALELPSYDDIVSDPHGTERPTRADLQMLMSYTLAGYAKPDDIGPIVTYMTEKGGQKGNKMPKDMAVTFISALLRRDYKGFVDRKPMQDWISKNATLITVLNSLSQK